VIKISEGFEVTKRAAASIIFLIVVCGLTMGLYTDSSSLEWTDVNIRTDSTYTIGKDMGKTAGKSNMVITYVVDVFGTAANDTINLTVVAYLNDPAVTREGITVTTKQLAGSIVDITVFDTIPEPFYSVFPVCSLYVDVSSGGTLGMDSVNVVATKKEY